VRYLIIFFYFSSIILISFSAILNENLPVNEYFVSEYIHGRYGWLITLSFIFMSIGGGLFLIVLFKKFSSTVPGYLMISLLVIWTISTGFLSVFPADLRNSVITDTGQIHQFLAAVTFSTAIIINIVGLIIDFKFKINLSVIISGVITLIVISGLILLSFKNINMQGIHQRMIVYPELLWFIVQSFYKIKCTNLFY
jgi:hypothetical protein